MSFDVYFQRFADGESVSGGGDRMRRVLAPFIVREEPAHHFALLPAGLDDVAVVATGADVLRVIRSA